jgi:hypothetical protein
MQDQPPMPPPPYGAPNQPQYGDQPGYADPNQPHYGGPAQPNFPPPAPPPSKRGQWLRIGVIVLLAVVVGGGFYFFRDRLSSSASDLAVGDCIDEPAGTTDISEVQHQPCNEPHDGEVFAVITHTAPSGATYPLSTEFRDLVSDECLPAMETYAGSSYLDMYANGYDVSFLYPTSASWTDGDRGVTCFIVKSDETKMTGSLRVGAATPLP